MIPGTYTATRRFERNAPGSTEKMNYDKRVATQFILTETQKGGVNYQLLLGGTGPDTTGWVTDADTQNPEDPIAGIANGSEVGTRKGRKIMLTNIRVKGALSVSSGNGHSPSVTARIMLVLCKAWNGGSSYKGTTDGFKISDLLYGPTGVDATGKYVTFAFQNLDNVDNFQILKDKTVTIHSYDPSQYSSSEINFKINKKVNMPIVTGKQIGRAHV